MSSTEATEIKEERFVDFVTSYYQRFEKMSFKEGANLLKIVSNIGGKMFSNLPKFFETFEYNMGDESLNKLVK